MVCVCVSVYICVCVSYIKVLRGRGDKKRFEFLALNTSFIVFDRKDSYLIFLALRRGRV